jgi:hypothetical protein
MAAAVGAVTTPPDKTQGEQPPTPASKPSELVLANGQRLTGTIVATLGDRDFITIDTGSGTMRIRRALLASTGDPGLEERLAALKPRDLPGHLALARWCRDRALNDRALDLLRRAQALPGFATTPDGIGLLARLLDEAGRALEAMPLYAAYRDAGGTDQTWLRRIAELEASKAAWEAQNGPMAPTGSLPPPAPSAPTGLTANWERENEQYSNPVQVQVSSLATARGDVPAIAVTVSPGARGKGALRRSVRLDLSGQDTSAFVLQVANPGSQPVALALAVKTGNWVFFESTTQTVAPGPATELRFDLRATTYKSQSSDWNPTGKIAQLDDVRELQLLVYNGNAEAQLVLAQMAFGGRK